MWYAVAQVPIFLAALLLPHRSGAALSLLAVAVGAVSLLVCTVVLRPKRALGWCLASSSALVVLVSITAFGRAGDLQPPIDDFRPLVASLAGSGILLASGLLTLGRRPHSPAGIADVLDAALIAAGVVLLAWMLLDGSPWTNAHFLASIGLPLVAVLLVVSGLKLVLAAGWRVPALTILVASGAALLSVLCCIFIPQLAEIAGGRPIRMLWTAHGGLLGAAALHPSFVHATRGLAISGGDLSAPRLVAYSLTAALVPAAVLVGLTNKPPSFDRSLPGVAVPAAAATTVLVSLVARLALDAHGSQRRAAALAQRSSELTAALSRQDALSQELAHRAMHDPLTGLSNRVVLAERLEWTLERSSASRPAALLLLDLDGFKDINDTYGHPVGDELLSSVGHRLLTSVPAEAVVARLGGDEFAVLLDPASTDGAMRLADGMLTAIRRPLVIDGQELVLSASIGVLVTDAGSHRSSSDVLRDADLALYAAKNGGKNRVEIFQSRLRNERLEHARIVLGLHRALLRGELDLEYQPIVELSTGRILAVEALARWRTPDGTVVPPSQFIPVAETSGLIDALGAQALHRACRDARRWNSEHGIAVTVNVSGHQLRNPDFCNVVTRTLSETGLPAEALILELTEDTLVTALPDNPETAQLLALREGGVRIAIDDFGTGYSSLAYLGRLPVDIVKLDRSFADIGDDSGGDRSRWTFTSAILDAISSLHLRAVAEGVETADQAHTLASLRCAYAQGYYFYRPMPATRLDHVLSVADRAHSAL